MCKGYLNFDYPVLKLQFFGMLHRAVWYMVIDVLEKPATCVMVALNIESVSSWFILRQQEEILSSPELPDRV
jgi:hypothetical protein